MTWTCKQCGHSTNATVKYPLRCRCGLVDYGDHISLGATFINHQQRILDILAFMVKIPYDVTAVAGVPRSGMFAASMIAEQMHLALYSLCDENLVRLSSGFRHKDYIDDGTLLVVDDTVASGHSIQTLPDIDRQHLLAAIYVTPERAHLVDLFYKKLSSPHYLEWNIFNSIYTKNLATDIDGILCSEVPNGLSQCAYERWVQHAPILQRPVYKTIPLIATGRKRMYRKHTEEWLDKYGIKYDKLVFPKNDEEHKYPAVVKGNSYKESPATIFMESCPIQAKTIAEISGKRVICPKTSEVHN